MVLAVGLFVAPACSGPRDGNEPGADRTTTATASAIETSTPGTTAVATTAGPKLVDAGAAPRTVLLLRPREGTTTTVAVTTDLAVTQELSTGDRRVDPPPVTQTIAYRVGAGDDEGATVAFRVEDVTVATRGTDLTPAEVIELTDALKPIRGLEGRGRLAVDGRFADVELDVPSGLAAGVRAQLAALRDQLGALGPRLPAEAVGVGASWTTQDTTELAGVELQQTTTFEVTGIDDDMVTYRSTSTASGDRQPLRVDGLATGAGAELVSARLTGTATGSIDLTAPVGPLKSDVAGTQVIEISAAKVAPRRLTQRVSAAVRVRLP